MMAISAGRAAKVRYPIRVKFMHRGGGGTLAQVALRIGTAAVGVARVPRMF
jgi:hypothetical protein